MKVKECLELASAQVRIDILMPNGYTYYIDYLEKNIGATDYGSFSVLSSEVHLSSDILESNVVRIGTNSARNSLEIKVG